MFKTLLVICALACVPACSKKSEPESTADKAPLYDNLGNYHHEITTSSPEAQKYFDQGLTLSYAFNHAEAIRSFKQAAALDPDCAMCYWGVAYALGPNINAPITPEAAKEAFDAIGQARQRATKASAKEQAYIEALAKRYASDPKAERPPLDAAYAAFEEKSRGTIEPGKLADFTIVEGDFFNTPLPQLHATRVRATVVGGDVVWNAK